jgi:predicted ArsR family transcriptional regulator
MKTMATEAELLAQVQDALTLSSDPEGAVSTIELSEALGIPPNAVRERLRKLIANGTVEVVRVPRTNIVGVVQHQYCYRLFRKEETPGKNS